MKSNENEMEENSKIFDSKNPHQKDNLDEAGLEASDPLAQEIADLKAQLKEKDNKYIYLYADFENSKKRSLKERSELIKFGWESVARDLLQCVDNLERALEHAPDNLDKNFLNGLKMTFDHFISSLQKQGVKTIDCLKQPFDPNFHEAVGEVDSELPEGTIVNELSKGYTLHGRLLRPSSVQVSSAKKVSH